eukprot:13491654-Ditylum_brightwellii.AAC.1
MRHQRFNCAAKGQAKFINFCANLESLDSTKAKRENNKSRPKLQRPTEKSQKGKEEVVMTL